MRSYWWIAVLAVPLAFVAIALGTAHSQGVGPVVSGWSEVVEQPVTPQGVRPGTTVSATGTRFGVIPGTVEVGCLGAEVVSWGTERVAFVVPAMPPAPRPVQVTIFTEDGRYYRAAAFPILAP